ncbi:MAG: heme-binding protein [Chthoniobacteraceae bacterium]
MPRVWFTVPAVQTLIMRPATILAAILAALAPVASAGPQQLTQEEVAQVVEQGCVVASRINRSAIICVTDREGFILALWDVKKRLPNPLPPFTLTPASIKLYGLVAAAVTKASTAAFLSSDQEAFTSRTAGYIIQQHFPVGVRNTPNGPLVGVGFSSLFFTDVNRAKLVPQSFVGDESIRQMLDRGKLLFVGRAPGFGATTGTASASYGDLSPGVRAPLFPLTSLNDSPGGVPLYKAGHLVGGVGVTGDGDPTDLTPAAALLLGQIQKSATPGFKVGSDADEYVALGAQTDFRPPRAIVATNVLINGIRIPYVFPRLEDIDDVDDVPPIGTIGRAIDVPLSFAPFTALGVGPLVPNQAVSVPPATDAIVFGFPKAAPAPYPYEIARLGGFEGDIRFPFRDDPLLHDADITNDRIHGNARRLQRHEVKDIIELASRRARITRAGIRLPIGSSAHVFITVVNNPDKPGEFPQILGVFGTHDATIFSWDVAVQKARTAVFFSNTQLAMSSRSVGFLAQRFFPPGIDGTAHGPYFGFQEAVTLKFRRPLDVFRAPADLLAGKSFLFPGNPNLPNGITIFPGGFPLYRDGYLVGAIGISGDGVDQDDIIGISGTEDFRPAPSIRADQYTYRGARLPYVKFPRDPVR